MYASYNDLLTALQAKRRQRKALTEERDALPLLAISQKRELTEKIQGLTEEVEELKNEEAAILQGFRKEEAIRSMAAQPNKRGAITKQARKEIFDFRSRRGSPASRRERNRIRIGIPRRAAALRRAPPRSGSP